MSLIRTAIAGILSLLVATSASGQQFPTVPNHTVIGRIGQVGDSGPSQAIPFATLFSQIAGVIPANTVFAGPTTGPSSLGTARLLVGADLPLPGASSLGGVFSKNCSPQLIQSINTDGTATCNTQIVTNIAALRALAAGVSTGIYVQGYYTAGDAGAGYFVWNGSSSATDNAGTIIQPNAGGIGRWIRSIPGPTVAYTPEMFGAQQTPGVTDDAAAIRAAMLALNTVGKGLLKLGPVTYRIATAGVNGAMLNNYSGVSIIGNGQNSVLQLANGIITSNATFVHMMIPTGNTISQAINNVTYKDFLIDMNGANNSCSGTCFNSNETLGAFYGENITVDNVTIINNPGSQGFSFGSTFAAFPTMTDVRIINSHLSNFCDAVNAACTDASALWIHVENGVVANNTVQNCGTSKGTGLELHGFNVAATGNQVWNCNIGVIMSSDTGSAATNSNGINVVGNNIQAVNTGVSLQIVTLTSSLDYLISGNNIGLNSVAGVVGGIDASSIVSATATTGLLNITGNVITSALSGTLPNANDFFGIAVQYFNSANVANNTISNIAGPGIYFPTGTTATTSVYNVSGNILQDVGRVASGGTLAAGILFVGGGNTARVINIHGNSVTNTSTVYAATGVSGSMNASGGLISANITNNVTTPITWTGTGTNVGTSCGSVTAASVTSVNGIITHC